MVAQHHRRLHPVRAEGHSIVLRLLSERRDDLAEERTRTANRLHALLRDLIAGGAKRNLTAEQAAALPRGVRPVTVVISPGLARPIRQFSLVAGSRYRGAWAPSPRGARPRRPPSGNAAAVQLRPPRPQPSAPALLADRVAEPDRR